MTFVPKPQFFLIRPGAEKITPTGQIIAQPATAVPLIPADLLPGWVDVVGVPRSLSPDETKDMGNLGVVHAEQHIYKLRFASVTEEEILASYEVDEDTECTSMTMPDTTNLSPSGSYDGHQEDQNLRASTPASSQSPTPQKKLKPAQGLSSSRHNPENQQQQPVQPKSAPKREPPSISPNTTSPSSQLPSPCRHWCQQGVCKWGADCHHEHTMPTSSAGLAEVGLAQFPDWWLQARGVIPMPPEVLRAADITSARRMDKKLAGSMKKKPKFRGRAKRIDVQLADLYENLSEADAEDNLEKEFEKKLAMGNEVVKEPETQNEGILIEL
ncbi:uncharacterized protein B0J16DRAFT_10927 [Fusarium flagelliforme]|uniref:Transcription factor n=1 Tax=Fusarium flagelliforme TaxID=2675880 RepID=A0A395MYM4_9HYPO|nr:uncharacterized protein B0J16DRAFT_10927 [Fusarium flagelliforme]KAH7197004.1 hypothetical protein B0J16DRAFT_10927 [Fusarium flagelliforme]RFN52309.1 transcription factor [Fusarium flagelliforme]